MTRLPELWRAEAQPAFRGPALVDTHVWIWYLDGARDHMAPAAVELLRRCAKGAGLLVSDISVWEVGTKVARGKLRLLPDVATWIDRATRQAGLTFLPLDREILLYSTHLPGTVHGDPADRMLIASSTLARVPLLTADGPILDYARSEPLFSACDVRP